MNNLRKKKAVIWCGDLNVTHQVIDIHDPKGKSKLAGYTPQERKNFDDFLKSGWVDTFRHLNPTTRKFSYWSMIRK